MAAAAAAGGGAGVGADIAQQRAGLALLRSPHAVERARAQLA